MSIAQQAAELLAWIDERATVSGVGKVLPKCHIGGFGQRLGQIWRDSVNDNDQEATEGLRALCDAMNWDWATQAFFRGLAQHPGVAANSLCPPIGGDWCWNPAALDKIHVALRLLAGGVKQPPTMILDDNDVAILRYLAETPGVAKSQDDIAAGANVGRKAVGERLAKLREAGYVSRPSGKKTKDAITPDGIERIRQK